MMFNRRQFVHATALGTIGATLGRVDPAWCQSQSWHERLPKVELHLHLDGALPKATLWELLTNFRR